MRKLKAQFIQYLVKNLLVGVNEDDILQITSLGWFLNKRKLTPEEVAFLKEEAKSIQESSLWGLMHKDVRYMANLRMFEKGLVPENTLFGRAMLYDLELLRQYVDRFTNL